MELISMTNKGLPPGAGRIHATNPVIESSYRVPMLDHIGLRSMLNDNNSDNNTK